MLDKIILIAGVPRSGTSWLGEIIDSHPSVKYRYQPLFSYAFKDAINRDSTSEEMKQFLNNVYHTKDPFITRKKEQEMGITPKFKKHEEQSVLVMKHVRYHYLLEKFINYSKKVKILGIVRNPCAVINSFLKSPRELKGYDPVKEWEEAPHRNTKPENYFGFKKWKEATQLFLSLQNKYPEQFYIVKYKNLIMGLKDEVKRIFNHISLEENSQTRTFLEDCHTKHINHEDAVFRNRLVNYKWIWQLNQEISKKIIYDIINTPLEQFL